jgi:hypothetical protein
LPVQDMEGLDTIQTEFGSMGTGVGRTTNCPTPVENTYCCSSSVFKGSSQAGCLGLEHFLGLDMEGPRSGSWLGPQRRAEAIFRLAARTQMECWNLVWPVSEQPGVHWVAAYLFSVLSWSSQATWTALSGNMDDTVSDSFPSFEFQYAAPT